MNDTSVEGEVRKKSISKNDLEFAIMATPKPHHHIYIVGAQNTGKTTLVDALSTAFAANPSEAQPNIIKEVARTVLRKHHFTAEDIRTSPSRALQLQELILKAQFEAENEVLKHGGWFISDRSGVDPIVYARKYVSEEAALVLRESKEWVELKERMKRSVVIVCQAGADWLMDDGVRLMPENREAWVKFDELFCSYLDDWGFTYEVVPCTMVDIAERVAFVLQKWRDRQSRLG